MNSHKYFEESEAELIRNLRRRDERYYNPGNSDIRLTNNPDNSPYWVTDQEAMYKQPYEDSGLYDNVRHDYQSLDFHDVHNMGHVSDPPKFDGSYHDPSIPSYTKPNSQGGNPFDDVSINQNAKTFGRDRYDGHPDQYSNTAGEWSKIDRERPNGRSWYKKIDYTPNTRDRVRGYMEQMQNDFREAIPVKFKNFFTGRPKKVTGTTPKPRYRFAAPADYYDVDPFGHGAEYYPDTAGQDDYIVPEYRVDGNYKMAMFKTTKNKIEAGVFTNPWQIDTVSSDHAMMRKQNH